MEDQVTPTQTGNRRRKADTKGSCNTVNVTEQNLKRQELTSELLMAFKRLLPKLTDPTQIKKVTNDIKDHERWLAEARADEEYLLHHRNQDLLHRE